MKYFCLLFLGLCLNYLTAQATSVEDRITAVENGLIPYVPVKGFPSWNIVGRMAHYHVPGVRACWEFF